MVGLRENSRLISCVWPSNGSASPLSAAFHSAFLTHICRSAKELRKLPLHRWRGLSTQIHSCLVSCSQNFSCWSLETQILSSQLSEIIRLFAFLLLHDCMSSTLPRRWGNPQGSSRLLLFSPARCLISQNCLFYILLTFLAFKVGGYLIPVTLSCTKVSVHSIHILALKNKSFSFSFSLSFNTPQFIGRIQNHLGR